MKTTEESTVTSLEGLEDFGNSQVVTSIGDFLRLEDLDFVEETDPDAVELTEVEPVNINEEEDEIVPLDNPKSTKQKDDPDFSSLTDDVTDTEEIEESDEIDLGEDNELGESEGTHGGDYKQMVQELIDQGIWEAVDAFETEDGEVPFDEMNFDKETFLELLRHNHEEFKNKIKETTIPTDGMSDFTKKLITIEKHGGNVTQALVAYQNIQEPLNNIDISDVRGQRAICYLRLQEQGIGPEEAKDLIETYERKGVLEDKATGYKEQLENAFKDWMDKKTQEAIEEDKRYQDSLKTYRKTLGEALKQKSEFNLSETHRRKLVDIATKEQEGGDFELDTLIENHRKNPQDAADLLLFITDKEGYIKSKAEKLLEKERKDTLRKISIIPKSSSGSINLSNKNKSKSDKDVIIPLDQL